MDIRIEIPRYIFDFSFQPYSSFIPPKSQPNVVFLRRQVFLDMNSFCALGLNPFSPGILRNFDSCRIGEKYKISNQHCLKRKIKEQKGEGEIFHPQNLNIYFVGELAEKELMNPGNFLSQDKSFSSLEIDRKKLLDVNGSR